MSSANLTSNVLFDLDKLPTELQIMVLSKLNDTDRNALVDFTRVNSHYRSIATKIMLSRHQYDSNQDPTGEFLAGFISVMQKSENALFHLRDLVLETGWWRVHAFDDTTFISSPIDRANSWMRNLLGEARQLKNLKVAYDRRLSFLDTIPPKLESLIVRPQGIAAYRVNFIASEAIEYGGTLDLHFLPAALKSQSLKRLDFGATSVINQHCLSQHNFPLIGSSIEELVVRVTSLKDSTLIKLLLAPRGLKAFDFTPLTWADVYNDHLVANVSSPISWNFGLPRPSAIAAALRQHIHTLESLTLNYGDSEWESGLDTLSSLTEFTSLKTLSLPATMLLGWNHCHHIALVPRPKPLSPSKLASLLPASLECLIFKFEQHHIARNGLQYVLEIVKSLKQATATTAGATTAALMLPRLSLLVIDMADISPYCIDCDDEAEPDDEFGFIGWQEAKAVEREVREVPWRFEFLGDRGAWFDEENHGMVIQEDIFLRPW